MDWHLAQLNIARLRAPLDDPATQDFVDALNEINALAEASPGFVWRLQTNDGNATSIKAFADDMTITNMSTWQSIQTLSDFAYRSAHVDYLRRKREWFDAIASSRLVLWWVPAGTQPTVADAIERLGELDALGSSDRAFTFAKPFPPGPHQG